MDRSAPVDEESKVGYLVDVLNGVSEIGEWLLLPDARAVSSSSGIAPIDGAVLLEVI